MTATCRRMSNPSTKRGHPRYGRQLRCCACNNTARAKPQQRPRVPQVPGWDGPDAGVLQLGYDNGKPYIRWRV